MKRIIPFLVFALLPLAQIEAQTIDATLIENNFIGDSNPKGVTKIGNKILFSADDGVHGQELWMHDTETNSSIMLKDINEGQAGSLEHTQLIAIGNIVYFPAVTATSNQLWRSDGTSAGTYMVKDINASEITYTSTLSSYNGKLFFSANDGTNGEELWVSDGTEAGTSLLKDINEGAGSSNPYGSFHFGGYLYFVVMNNNTKELWKTDGTTAGTVKVEIGSVSISATVAFIPLNDTFYFYGFDVNHGIELWKSDGTEAGTELVKDIRPGYINSAENLYGAILGDKIIFMAQNGNTGMELWITDGTAEGTVLLKDINSGPGSLIYDAKFVKLGDNLYFIADDGVIGRELWKTDGTTAGTELVKDIFPGADSSNIINLTAVDNFLIFSAKTSLSETNMLWKSDGTTAGTLQLKDINLDIISSMEQSFTYCNGFVYFQAGYASNSGVEMWKTDGSTENTVMLSDINHIAGSQLDFTKLGTSNEINNTSVFFNSVQDSGFHPFTSNGTIEGTKVLNDNAGNSIYVDMQYDATPLLTKSGNQLFFRASNSSNGYELYKTDGTPEGTGMVKDIAPGTASAISTSPFFMSFNTIFYFKANDQIHGEELWRTDGTEAGTYILKDINPGIGNGISQANYSGEAKNYAIFNGLLYFVANDGTGNFIWSTDGTEAGTIKTTFIPLPGGFYTNPLVLNSSDNKLYFTAKHTGSYYNNTIWSTDGTLAGSQLLATYDVASPISIKSTVFNNNLYYTVQIGNTKTIMKTDGTVNGTIVIKDNILNATFKYLDPCGSFVYFSVFDMYAYNQELWRTDGTPNGTIMVSDTTTANHSLSEFACIQDHLVYLQNNGTSESNQLWITDGTLANTNTITVNVTNGQAFSANKGVTGIGTSINNKLLLTATTPLSGNELYAAEIGTLELGIDDHDMPNSEQNHIIAFPNPTNGILTIKSKGNNAIVQTITVYDFAGKQIKNENFDSTSATVSMAGLSKGLYFVKIKTNTTVETKKIMVK